MRCSAPARATRRSAFSPRSRSISPIVPNRPATPEPIPAIACRTGSSARVVTRWTVTAGSVELASSMSRLAMVNPANQSPARLRRCGLDGPYIVRRSARRARELLADQDPLELVELLEHPTCATNDAGERIVGDVDRHLRRLRHPAVEPNQEGAAAGEDDPLVHDVGHELRGRLLDRLLDRVDDLRDRRFQRLADLVTADLDAARKPGDQIPAAERHRPLVPALGRVRRADGDLDLLGRPLAHEEVVFAASESDDVGVHLIATDADRATHDDPAEADDRDFGGSSADVDDEAARRLADR